MASWKSRAVRAIIALPFLVITVLGFVLMDMDKVLEHQQPALQSGRIEWDGGSIPILSTFYHCAWDETWRGFTVTLSPSTLGYDPVSWWQVFGFCMDLAPLYAIWMLESHRLVNAYTPAYFAAIFTTVGQAMGIGNVTPFFYYLCFVFGPTASDLAKLSGKDGEEKRRVRSDPFILPLMLSLHTFEIAAGFLAPVLASRHFWTWTWQLSPLFVGLADVVLTRLFYKPWAASAASKPSLLASPAFQLGVLALLSAGLWVYTVGFAPFSLSEIFVPESAAQEGLILHSRLVFQVDQWGAFVGSFLWIVYGCADLYTAGLLGDNWVYGLALLPIVGVLTGPGAAFAFAWYWKEAVTLSSPISR